MQLKKNGFLDQVDQPPSCLLQPSIHSHSPSTHLHTTVDDDVYDEFEYDDNEFNNDDSDVDNDDEYNHRYHIVDNDNDGDIFYMILYHLCLSHIVPAAGGPSAGTHDPSTVHQSSVHPVLSVHTL